MGEGMPPALPLFLAALALPLLPPRGRRIACLLGPLIGFVALGTLAEGESWQVSFLGFPLTLVRCDPLSRIFGIVFLLVSVAANLYGWHRSNTVEQVAGLLYAAGGLAVVFAGDLVTMLIACEIMAVSSTLLVFVPGGDSLRAGQRYLMVHLAAGGVMLLGVLLVILETGSVHFGNLRDAGIGAAFILVALCTNAAVPPLHAWLPDAYPRASVSGSVFLSAFTTKASIYCLVRGFPGSEVLLWGGAVMAVYGVVFAVLENNIRRLLAYHIVSQVGYMVCAVGIGTQLALNGAVAHAFCHILYKGLLFMGTGAVLFTTGRDKLSDLGGLARTMPWTLGLYMIGALSISGAPLFNGFVSKSLVVSAAAEDGHGLITLLLNLAAVGTFLSVALKLPYFAWVAEPREVRFRTAEAPLHMRWAMAFLAVLCILLGVAPGWLYEHLPFPPVDYHPYSLYHIFEMLLVMTFTTIAFWQLRDRLRPHAALTLDTDWLYRRAATWLVGGVAKPLDATTARMGGRIASIVDRARVLSRNPPFLWSSLVGALDRSGDAAGGDPPPYDADRQRPPVALGILWVLTILVLLALAFTRA